MLQIKTWSFCILSVYQGNKINFHYKYKSRTVSVTVKKMVQKWMPSFAKRIGVTKSQPKYHMLDLNWQPLNWGSLFQVPLGWWPYFLILWSISTRELLHRIKNGINCMSRSQDTSSSNLGVGWMRDSLNFYLRVWNSDDDVINDLSHWT